MGNASDQLAARDCVSAESVASARPGRNQLTPVNERPAARSGALRFAPALIFLAIVIADCGRYADTDLWGHLWFGKLLLQRGPHPGPDPYSYAPHRPDWLHHEWLSEVLMAWLYAGAGVVGLKLWKLACSAATMLLIATAQAETGAPVAIQLVVLLTVACGLIPYMQFRPLLFSYVFTAAVIALITRDNYRGKAPPWLMVPGFALWSNLHGSFFVGLGVLGIYTAVRGTADLMAGRGVRRGLKLAAIALASSLATLVTPYGIATWRAVAISLQNPLTRHIMADWRPLLTVLAQALGEPHGGALFLWIAIAIILALAVSLLIAPYGDDHALVAVAAVINLGAFIAVRNVPLALIASAPPLTRHLGLALRQQCPREPAGIAAGIPASPPPLSWTTQIFVASLAVVMLAGGGLFSRKLPTAMNYPDGAIAFMNSHHLRGNILNYFAWGQYLIWHESPDSKVFIDGRYDLVYPPGVVTDYLAFYNADHGAQRVLDGFPHDFVLIPPSAPSYRFMLAQLRWTLIYRDDRAALFARKLLAATAMPPVLVDGPAPPSYFP